MVYRNAEYNVKFVGLNAVTYRLIKILLHKNKPGEQALILLAKELNHKELNSFIKFGCEILMDLNNQGAILGVLKPVTQ